MEVLAVEGEGFVDGLDGAEVDGFEGAGVGEDVGGIVRGSPLLVLFGFGFKRLVLDEFDESGICGNLLLDCFWGDGLDCGLKCGAASAEAFGKLSGFLF